MTDTTARYEYRDRHNDQPISTHRTLEAAERASVREHTGFRRSEHGTGGAYLQRVIVEVTDGRDTNSWHAPRFERELYPDDE